MASWQLAVVVNMESDEPELLGTYVGSEEDAVGYKSTAGVTHWVPADCVQVVSLACFEIVGAKYWAVRHGAV